MNNEQLIVNMVSIALSIIAVVCSAIAIAMNINDRRRKWKPIVHKPEYISETSQSPNWTVVTKEYSPSSRRHRNRKRKNKQAKTQEPADNPGSEK